MKKPNKKAISRQLLLPAIAALTVGLVGTYLLTSSNAARPKSNSLVYTYQAKDMYGVGSGITLVTSGKGKNSSTYQEFSQGTKTSLVNQTNVSTLQAPLNNWSANNAGKPVKFCVTAMSAGASSSLWANANNLGWTAPDGQYYEGVPSLGVKLTASNTFGKYCTPTYKIITSTPVNGNVTVTIAMSEVNPNGVNFTPTTSGPMRVSSFSFELQ